MPALYGFFFGSLTRVLATSTGLFGAGYVLGVKTSDAAAVAAGVATFWYLSKGRR